MTITDNHPAEVNTGTAVSSANLALTPGTAVGGSKAPSAIVLETFTGTAVSDANPNSHAKQCSWQF